MVNNIKEKSVYHRDLRRILEANCEFMRTALDGYEDMLKYFNEEDEKKLKSGVLKPDAKIALALLEYIKAGDSQAAKVIKMLVGFDFQRYLDWVNIYCKEYNCSKEYVLTQIIKENF